MIENIKNKHETKKTVETVEAPVVGIAETSTLFEFQTLDRLGIKSLKVIGKNYLSGDSLLRLDKIADTDSSACMEFLMSLEYEANKNFINTAHTIAALCDEMSAEQLINCGAAQMSDDVRDIALKAFFGQPELFKKVLESKGQTQPFPERSYHLFHKNPSLVVVKDFSEEKLETLKEIVGELYSKKGCTTFARVMVKKTKNYIGVMLEHGTRKSGYSTLNDFGDKLEPQSATMRLRNTDFVMVDKINQTLWVNSSLLTGGTRADFLMALGNFFCGDTNAFSTSLEINMDLFNSTQIASNMKGYVIPAIKTVELREFYYSKVGIHRGPETKVPGPSRRGCITDSINWASDLPEAWQTTSADVLYETNIGVRETITISPKSIRLSCSPNFNLAIALLNYLKVIPNNGN